MSKEAVLIYPHQLFQEHPCVTKDRPIYLVEDARFFTDFNIHKQKLVLHRAAMRAYYAMFKKKNYRVTYVEYMDAPQLFARLKKDTIATVHVLDPVDHVLEKRLLADARKAKIQVELYETPMFLQDTAWIEKNYAGKKKFLMYAFYKKVRAEHGILMHNGKPVGGAWSYDADNRERLPNNIRIPRVSATRANAYVQEAYRYVQKHFPDNPGELKPFIYPVTHAQAKAWLKQFLEKRFKQFGPYQDAIDKDRSFLFHSVLTPMLNTGLLTPQYVLDKTLAYAQKHNVPLNSTEGFVRQLTGWREYMRAVYVLQGTVQRKSNYFKHTKKLPQSFWHGATGIEPVDCTIARVLQTAYAHHIERLMVLGNIMLLGGYKPDAIYTWFMELFIDAYDWVMVPNVYGMSQYADGGMLSTKPYFSSSRYVLQMSNYHKGDWCDDWDALYWAFVVKHKKIFAKNPRMNLIMAGLKNIKKETLAAHVRRAKKVKL